VIIAERNLISNGLTDLMHATSTGEFRLTLNSAMAQSELRSQQTTH